MLLFPVPCTNMLLKRKDENHRSAQQPSGTNKTQTRKKGVEIKRWGIIYTDAEPGIRRILEVKETHEEEIKKKKKKSKQEKHAPLFCAKPCSAYQEVTRSRPKRREE
jgi:hypothetical protein